VSDEATAVPAAEEAFVEEPPAEEMASTTRPRRIAVILLGVALALTIGALTFVIVHLLGANSRIAEQNRELDQQRELIEKKETFGAAMAQLLETASLLDGSLMSSLVPLDSYESIARLAWSHRWSAGSVEADTRRIQSEEATLKQLVSEASAQEGSNSSGTTYEAVIDDLGGGHVSTAIDDADTLCETDVLACVVYDDPFTVHFDAADATQPYMTDWLRTGIAYHEFAHVLQMTNPVATDTALEAFGGDPETMADCFALTYLSGWTLDHRVYVSSYEYWDVSIGYGYTCDEAQAQAVRDWYGQLGVHLRPISQSR
jgi:hypothetical protein